jgi:tRNA 2-thiouridine synthesizing protein A
MDDGWNGIDSDLDQEDQIKIETLVCDLQRLKENQCVRCGAAICGHEALMSLAMGFKDEPKCWSCLAGAMEYEREALRDQVFAYIKHRSCHYEGWRWASREEGFESDALPDCLWPKSAPNAEENEFESSLLLQNEIAIPETYDSEWDAGNMGCGDLVLDLRIRINVLKPGQVLKLRATNSGAPVDLPAWCRMTGNTLIGFRHPMYFIQRKAN